MHRSGFSIYKLYLIQTGASQLVICKMTKQQPTYNKCMYHAHSILMQDQEVLFIKETSSYQSGNGLHTETQTRSQHVVTFAEQTSSSCGVNIYYFSRELCSKCADFVASQIPQHCSPVKSCFSRPCHHGKGTSLLLSYYSSK
jgi:hypothetical protein